jgi:hypothetical protein
MGEEKTCQDIKITGTGTLHTVPELSIRYQYVKVRPNPLLLSFKVNYTKI